MKRLFFIISLILFSCSPEKSEPEPSVSYILAISVNPNEGGSVSPQSGTSYSEGTAVSLIATPSAEYLFDRWSGLNLNSTENPYSLTMDSNKSITAFFEKKQYPLTVNVVGQGAVSEVIVQQGRTDYNSGTIVRLTANPADGWIFLEWSGDLTGNENPSDITINSPKIVTAHFEEVPPQVFAFDFENAKSLVIGTPNDHGNVKMIIEDNSKSTNTLDMVDLSIPNAFDFMLNVEKTFQLEGSPYIFLFGNLQVWYDNNGDEVFDEGDGDETFSYTHPIIDTETGEFYDYGSALYAAGGGGNGPFYYPQSSSFRNLTTNSDENENYYTDLQFVQSYAEILKIHFEFIPNTDEDGGPNQIEYSQETLSLIGGGYYFVKANGDIVTRQPDPNQNFHEYYYRTSSGSTVDFSELVWDLNTHFTDWGYPDTYYEWRDFMLLDSNGELLLFKVLVDEGDVYQDDSYYGIYSIDFDGTSVSLNRINDINYNDDLEDDTDDANFSIFEGYDQQPTLYRRGSKNIIINSNQLHWGTLIWYYDDQSQTIEQNFITELQESTWHSSLKIETEDYLHLAYEQDIMRISFETLELEYVLQNSGYQIYSFVYLGEGVYQFYGISYNTGLKTLCEYDNGNITIIAEFDNDTDVFHMQQIGSFN